MVVYSGDEVVDELIPLELNEEFELLELYVLYGEIIVLFHLLMSDKIIDE